MHQTVFLCSAAARPKCHAELAKARAYKFQTRVRWKGEMTATVYARNHSYAIGKPASFDVSDAAPSALEYLLGALGGCLVMGLQMHASRAGVKIEQLNLHSMESRIIFWCFWGLKKLDTPA